MGFKLKIVGLYKEGSGIVCEYQVLEDTLEVYDAGVVYRHRFPNERGFFVKKEGKNEEYFKTILRRLIKAERKEAAVKGDLRNVRDEVGLDKFKNEEISVSDEEDDE